MSTPISLVGWAQRWGLSQDCLSELLAIMGTDGASSTPSVPPPPNASEAWAQSMIRLEAPRLGIYLTRNNVGALRDKRGVPVRYGLANESSQQNEVLKSGDLIGIRPIVITYQMVGCTIGQFVSREVKHPGWSYGGRGREVAQFNWAALVTKYGGDAKFATGEGSFL